METEMKFNEQSLNYHKKIQDWSQIYHLTDDGKIYKASRVRYLPLHKVQQIETWRKDVSKTCRKSQSATKSSKNTDVWTLDDFSERPKTTSGVAPIQTGISQQNVTGHWLKGQVVNGKLNFEKALSNLSNNLAETSLHYAAQRSGAYLANTSHAESIKINGEKANDEKIGSKSTKPIDHLDKQTPANHTGEKADNNNPTTQSLDYQSLESTKDTSSVETISNETDQYKMATRGNTIFVHDRPLVSFRSCSNNLLNVISVDDLKHAHYHRNRQSASDFRNDQVPNKLSDPTYPTSKDSSEKNSKNDNGSSQLTSRSGRKPQVNRTTKITNAIDTIVTDRKVMNTLDRNFDTRIGSKTRTGILKPEGGRTFRRLNKTLRRHIEHIAFNNGSFSNGSDVMSAIIPGKEADYQPTARKTNGNIHSVKEDVVLADHIPEESEFGMCESETLADTASTFYTHDIGEHEALSFAVDTPAIHEELDEYENDSIK